MNGENTSGPGTVTSLLRSIVPGSEVPGTSMKVQEVRWPCKYIDFRYQKGVW